jgi:hypothetical protein
MVSATLSVRYYVSKPAHGKQVKYAAQARK